MTALKPIAIFKPGALTENNKATLAEAGYIVIESDDLDCMKVVQPLLTPAGDGAVVFQAAIWALANEKYMESTTDKFGARLARILNTQISPEN